MRFAKKILSASLVALVFTVSGPWDASAEQSAIAGSRDQILRVSANDRERGKRAPNSGVQTKAQKPGKCNSDNNPKCNPASHSQ